MSVRVQVRSVPAPAREATSPAAEAKTRTAARPARPRGLLADGLVLSLLVALSPALTIAGLGFTGADWRLLRALGGAPQASLAALVRAVGAAEPQMPAAQVWYVALLYHLLGPQPLGYRVVNAALLVVAALASYLLLRELDLPRLMAVAIPAAAALLVPAFADAPSAFGGELAGALCAVSLYSEARALRGRLGRFWLWKPVALLSLVAAGMASSAVVALLLAGQLLTWRRLRALDGPELLRLGRARSAAARGGILLSAAAAVGACAWTASGSIPGDLGRAAATGPATQPLALLSQLELAVWRYPDHLPLVAAAAGGGLLLGAYLWHVSSPASSTMPRRPAWMLLALGGLAVLFAGAAAPDSAGLVPGAGLAMALLGCAGFVSSLLPSDLLRRELAGVLATAVCVGGFTVSGAAATPPGASAARQQAIVHNLAAALPAPPPHSAILVEEACPGRGLADPLAPQELAGLLATTYQDASLESAVLTSRVTVDRDLLTVVSSAGARVSYPYGAGLFVYNEAQGRVYRLQNADQAGRYFLTYADRTRACS